MNRGEATCFHDRSPLLVLASLRVVIMMTICSLLPLWYVRRAAPLLLSSQVFMSTQETLATLSSKPALTHATQLLDLSRLIDGSIHTDAVHKMLYAQDASIYQEEPAGVVFPRSRHDLERVVQMASQLNLSLPAP